MRTSYLTLLTPHSINDRARITNSYGTFTHQPSDSPAILYIKRCITAWLNCAYVTDDDKASILLILCLWVHVCIFTSTPFLCILRYLHRNGKLICMTPIQNQTDSWRPVGIAGITHDAYKISKNHGARNCGTTHPAGFISAQNTLKSMNYHA